MPSDSGELSISTARFSWVHAFTDRMVQLKAPAGYDELFSLGQRLYLLNARLDPEAVAQVTWLNWPEK